MITFIASKKGPLKLLKWENLSSRWISFLADFRIIFWFGKVKLSSITSVSLLDKRGFLTICLTLGSIREGRIYLRRAEGLRDWFSLLKVGNFKQRTRNQEIITIKYFSSQWIKRNQGSTSPSFLIQNLQQRNVTVGNEVPINVTNNDFIPDDDEGPDYIIRDNTPTGGTNNVPKGINRLSRKYDIIDIIGNSAYHHHHRGYQS